MAPIRRPTGDFIMQQTALLTGLAPVAQRHIAPELTLAHARDLLDWLEMHGISQFALETEESGRLTVTQRPLWTWNNAVSVKRLVPDTSW